MPEWNFDYKAVQALSYKDLPKKFSPLYEGGHKLSACQELVDGGVRERIISVATKVKKNVEGRDEEIDACIASFISGVPLVLFGPPGTAKSMLVRLISDYCTPPSDFERPDPRLTPYFEYLMTSHTMPEELFGAPNIEKLMEKHVFERETSMKLPNAEIAFLDELFRASGHILNTLLSLINERIFHNGVKPIDVPLIGVVTAANYPPSDSEVAAVFDRFPIRLHLKSILHDLNDDKTFNSTSQKLLKMTLDGEVRQLRRKDENYVSVSSEWLACTNDFRLARARLTRAYGEQMAPRVEDPRLQEFNNLFNEMREDFKLSDRTYGMLWRFGQALDWVRSENGSAITEPFVEYDNVNGEGHLDVFKWIASTSEECDNATDIVNEHKNEDGLSSVH